MNEDRTEEKCTAKRKINEKEQCRNCHNTVFSILMSLNMTNNDTIQSSLKTFLILISMNPTNINAKGNIQNSLWL